MRIRCFRMQNINCNTIRVSLEGERPSKRGKDRKVGGIVEGERPAATPPRTCGGFVEQ